MTGMEVVALIYSVGGVLFLGGLAVGVTTTGARVIYYHRNRKPRPRLLTRDILVKGGLAISFGLITVLRFLPQEARIAFTTGNVTWALVTTIPGVLAMLIYCYYEVFVIERAGR